MTTSVTLHLDPELKRRVAAVAEKLGMRPHAFMLAAIAEKTAIEEERQSFLEEADARLANMLATGKSIPWSEMRAWLVMRMKERER